MKSIFKPELIKAFLAGEIIIKNQVGGREMLIKLLSEAIPEAYVEGGFQAEYFGYDVRRNDWFAISKETDTGFAFTAVEIFDFINVNEIEVIEKCSGTCEVCTCKNKKLISFEASFSRSSISSDSFCVLVIKGDDKGKSWAHEVWLPNKYCTHTEPKAYKPVIVTAPLWLLVERGIQYSISLKNAPEN